MFNYLKLIGCSIILTFSCGLNDNKSSLAENVKVSSCGGFPTTNLSKRMVDTSEYCKAEKLQWTYNVTGQMLSVIFKRIIANCAAKYTVLVTKDADTLAFKLNDTCSDVDANCMCPFHLSCDIPGITGENIYILIKNEKFLIKLNELHGERIIDTTLTMCP